MLNRYAANVASLLVLSMLLLLAACTSADDGAAAPWKEQGIRLALVAALAADGTISASTITNFPPGTGLLISLYAGERSLDAALVTVSDGTAEMVFGPYGGGHGPLTGAAPVRA